jgi:hypothetical protein
MPVGRHGATNMRIFESLTFCYVWAVTPYSFVDKCQHNGETVFMGEVWRSENRKMLCVLSGRVASSQNVPAVPVTNIWSCLV